MSTSDVVTSARSFVGLVLADGQDARLSDILRALRLAHRGLSVAETALAPATTAPSDTLPSPAMGDEQDETQ